MTSVEPEYATAEQDAGDGGRRLAPADVQGVRFSSGTMLHPGYSHAEVDRFLARTAQEMARLYAEKAELRDQVHALSAQVEQGAVQEAPSDQAVRLLSTAQQTADDYVAEAEDFSRQMAADARARHEEQLRHARETAGAIIQAAQEAAARMVAEGGGPVDAVSAEALPAAASTQELEEQVAYLKAFAQACRAQLRAYLEALLTDVESEWGRANPAALSRGPVRTPAQRSAPEDARHQAPVNVAREMPLSDTTSEHPVVTEDGDVQMHRA